MAKISLTSDIYLKSSEVPENIRSKIVGDNTFPNPRYLSNEEQGRSNWNTARTIETYRFEGENIVLPRGYLSDLLALLRSEQIRPQITDDRVAIPASFPDSLKDVEFRPYQKEAISEAMRFDHGLIVSPTGSGKSIIGLEILRRRSQKSLIIVHRSDLADQWAKNIRDLLRIEPGIIGGGKCEIGEEITIGMIQTLSAIDKTVLECFGAVVVDEAHHIPAESFFSIIGQIPAKYRYGLSATPGRRDGLEIMIYHGIGPAIATISRDEVEDLGAIVPAEVISIQTDFQPENVKSWSEYVSALTSDAKRNQKIIELAQSQTHPTLILTDRVSHAKQLSEMLSLRNITHTLAHGKVENRSELLERIKKSQLTIATVSLIGEGIDVSCWGSLIMASPISSEVKLLQAIGRIVRPHEGKERGIVYDLRDNCGFSGASFKKRFEIYKKHKIWVTFQKDKKAA